MENQRAVTLIFIAGAVLVGLFVREFVQAVMGAAAFPDPAFVGITLSTLLGVLGGVVAFFAGLRHERATTFTDSVVSEMKKVTWPTREETTGNTGIVVGATVFFATLLAVYDFAWAKLTSLFLFTSG